MIFVAIAAITLISCMAYFLLAKVLKKNKPEPIRVQMLDEICQYPDGFFNLVKDALPKDRALIYEVESCKLPDHIMLRRMKWGIYDGEDEVKVTVYAPGETSPILNVTYNEEHHIKYDKNTSVFRARVQKDIDDMLLRRQKDQFAGHKEIIS